MKQAIGVDVGATKISAASVSDDGTLADFHEIETQANQGAEKVIANIINLLKQFHLDDIDAVGIGFPSPVENGVIGDATNIEGFANFPLTQKIRTALNKKVIVLNDADAALAGEMWQGAAKGKKNVLMLTLGSGIGGATTQKPNAELGHSVVDPGSVLTCNKGHRGDIESLIGGLVNEQRMGKSMAEIIKDPVFINEYVKWLTKGIEIIINQFNPELIVLGGGVVEKSSQYFFDKLPKFSVPVVKAKLGNRAGIFGAAKAAMRGGW